MIKQHSGSIVLALVVLIGLCVLAEIITSFVTNYRRVESRTALIRQAQDLGKDPMATTCAILLLSPVLKVEDKQLMLCMAYVNSVENKALKDR